MARDDDDTANSAEDFGGAEATCLSMNLRSRAADGYLREQTELAKLRKINLLEQNAFELSHLRFRRFSDYSRFALEIAGFLVVLLIEMWGEALIRENRSDQALAKFAEAEN